MLNIWDAEARDDAVADMGRDRLAELVSWMASEDPDLFAAALNDAPDPGKKH